MFLVKFLSIIRLFQELIEYKYKYDDEIDELYNGRILLIDEIIIENYESNELVCSFCETNLIIIVLILTFSIGIFEYWNDVYYKLVLISITISPTRLMQLLVRLFKYLALKILFIYFQIKKKQVKNIYSIT